MIKTRMIAGRKVNLIEGVRYRASRPMGVVMGFITVTIEPDHDGYKRGARTVYLDGFTYEKANKFLRKFNNGGALSFDGRIW